MHEFGYMLRPEFRMCHGQVPIGGFGAFLNDETTMRNFRPEAIDYMKLRGIELVVGEIEGEDLRSYRREARLWIVVLRRLKGI